jgi:hypothetical protein
MPDTHSERRTGTSRHRFRERARTAVVRRLGIDFRALAALRVSLGLLLVLDLALRARDLRAHYTDAGALPRDALAARYGALADVSIHALSGSVWFQALVFLVAAGFAVALALGYRTRLATVASWLLLASLHARNPLVLNAGDSLFRRLLFWGMFLPLGARWSIDAYRRRSSPPGEQSQEGSATRRRVVGVASAALLVQVVLVYSVNGLFKLRGDRWWSGEAVRIIYSLDSLTLPAGDLLAGFPGVLVFFDRLWFALLLSSVGLVLLAGWSRAAFAGLFAGAHLGMLLTLRLGVFPLVSIAGLLVFLPPAVWEGVERRLAGGRVHRTAARFANALARALPAGPRITPSGWNHPDASVWTSRITSGLLAVLLALVLVWNAATLGYVALPAGDLPVSTHQHRWDMFAPHPLDTDVRIVAPGTLESGGRVDAFRGGAVDWDRPPDVAETYPSSRWRKYLVDLWRPGYADLRPAFGAYLCRRYNAAHGDDLVNVSVYALEQPTRLDAPEPIRRVELWSGNCLQPTF